MFTVLEVEDKKTGFFQNIKERLHPTKPELKKVEVKGGAPFFILKIFTEKGEIPWDKVVYHAGRTSVRLVMQENIIPPKDSGVIAYTPEYLPMLILFNSALKTIKDDPLHPELRKLTILDKRGILAGRIEKAVEVVGEISVVTDNPYRYEAVAEKILKETGAVIRIVDEPDLSVDYVIADKIADINVHSKVFCLNYENIKAEEIVRLNNVSLPSEYEELRPSFISAITFASALYEMCGVRRLEDLA